MKSGSLIKVRQVPVHGKISRRRNLWMDRFSVFPILSKDMPPQKSLTDFLFFHVGYSKEYLIVLSVPAGLISYKTNGSVGVKCWQPGASSPWLSDPRIITGQLLYCTTGNGYMDRSSAHCTQYQNPSVTSSCSAGLHMACFGIRYTSFGFYFFYFNIKFTGSLTIGPNW
jgi:hypothetical protein